jgi:dephospho-CoA kinase
MNERVKSYSDTSKVVVLDIPLLVENPREGLDGVVVVDLDPEIAVERIVEQRKMNIDDAKARVANQSSREQRRAIANFIIDNSGDRKALDLQVDVAWSWINALK